MAVITLDTTDVVKVLTGSDGAAHVKLVDGSGDPVSPGDATAANQTLQLNQLNDIETVMQAGLPMLLLSGSITGGTVTALADIAAINVDRFARLFVEFTVDSAALSDFDVAFRCHTSASYVTVASIAADYTTPTGPVLAASGDLTTAGTSGTHWILLDVAGVQAVRLQAAGTSSVVAGYYGAN
jgi:hypothetical protein